MIIITTLVIPPGGDVGPFDLYSDSDGYTVPFATNVSASALEAGYSSTVPDDATIIRVVSIGFCTNFINLDINLITTTTTTSSSTSSTSTTTSTTTIAPLNFDAGFRCSEDSVDFSILNITGGVPFTTNPETYLAGNIKFVSEAAALANTVWIGPTNEVFYGAANQDATWWLVVKDSVGNILAKSVTSNCFTPSTTTTTTTI
jgi:hypothetical protein